MDVSSPTLLDYYYDSLFILLSCSIKKIKETERRNHGIFYISFSLSIYLLVQTVELLEKMQSKWIFIMNYFLVIFPLWIWGFSMLNQVFSILLLEFLYNSSITSKRSSLPIRTEPIQLLRRRINDVFYAFIKLIKEIYQLYSSSFVIGRYALQRKEDSKDWIRACEEMFSIKIKASNTSTQVEFPATHFLRSTMIRLFKSNLCDVLLRWRACCSNFSCSRSGKLDIIDHADAHVWRINRWYEILLGLYIYCYMFVLAGGFSSWNSFKAHITTLSTTHAKQTKVN